MRGLILSAAVALGALSAFTASPAAARDYQYCAAGRSLGYPGDCSYATYQQCAAAASGRDLYCNINPRFAFNQQQRGYDDGGYVQRPRANRRINRDFY
jgi:hypothetical protein